MIGKDNPALYVTLSVAAVAVYAAIGYGGRKVFDWATRYGRRH